MPETMENKVVLFWRKTGRGKIKSLSILFCALIAAILSLSCDVRRERGSYFVYGLQWGMTWKECVDRLKVEELKEADSTRGVKVGKAPFFIAGVPGVLTMTFKKSWFGDPSLKALRYDASILTSDTRGEAFNVANYELSEIFGPPAEKKGTVEDITFPDDHGDPYSAVWKSDDGNVYVNVDPNKQTFVMKAEANTTLPKLEWLK